MGLNISCGKNEITEYNYTHVNKLKSPYHNWDHLTKTRQSISELNSFDWGNVHSIGVITGYNNLISLDFDDCFDITFIKNIVFNLLGLNQDYEWLIKTGSFTGYHLLFFLDTKWPYSEFPEGFASDAGVLRNGNNAWKAPFTKLEVLINTNSVLPPSIHSSGLNYEFENCTIPSTKPEVVNFERFEELLTKITANARENALFLKEKNIPPPLPYRSISDKKILTRKEYNNDKNNIYGDELFLVIDIETDGLIEGSRFPNIIQIAWSIIDYYGYAFKKNCIIIDNGISENLAYNVNRINPTLFKSIGRPLREVLKELIFDVNIVNGIVAHNISFDLTVLKYYLKLNGFNNTFDHLMEICTMIGGAYYLQNDDYNIGIPINEHFTSTKYPSLLELYNKLYRTHLPEKHNASYDTSLTSLCFTELIKNSMIFYIDNSKDIPKKIYIGPWANSDHDYLLDDDEY